MNIPQAFEIPIPKTGKTPPPVAQRLADTPRNNSPSSFEINQKLENAAAKREDKKSVYSHRAEVERAKDELEVREREKADALREASKTKQDNAAVKRENDRLSWVQKIAAATNQKLAKGKATIEKNELKARELEATLNQKIANAEDKREQLRVKNVRELVTTNEEKLRRAYAALAKAEANSRRLESEIDTKIANANARKEMTLEKIQNSSSQTETKLARGKIALSIQNDLAKKTMQLSLKKLEAANERREGLVRDQVELLRAASSKKEQRIVEKQLQDDDAKSALQKTLMAKLNDAELARCEILKAKANKAAVDDHTRMEKAKAAASKEFELQRVLGKVVQDKMKNAEARKLSLSKKMVHSPRERETTGSSLTVADIESKIRSAADRRENFLAARTSSSKRVHSPRGPAPALTIDLIEEKLNSAAERREIYLKNKKVSKISKSSPRTEGNVAKTLSFSSVSPGTSPGTRSPRLKAAKLEARSKGEDSPPFLTPLLLSSFAVAFLGMVVFARCYSSK